MTHITSQSCERRPFAPPVRVDQRLAAIDPSGTLIGRMSMDAEIPAPRRVLIIKPSALGDVVTALPVLRGLRRSFGPDLPIDWMLSQSCAAAVAEDPDLDNVVPFDRKRYGRIWCNPLALKDFLSFCRRLRRAGYDWVIDLQGLFRSGFFAGVTGAAIRAGFASARECAGVFYNRILGPGDSRAHTIHRNISLARMLGIDARSEDFRLRVPPSALPWAKDFVAEHGDRFIVVAPAARWVTKLYPTRHWRNVLTRLAKRRKLVLTAGPDETQLTAPLADIDNVIDLAGKTTIAQLIALIAAGSGVISGDSATMNIAAALGVRQVTLIGPTDPERTGPYRATEGIVQTHLPCRACLKRRCPHIACMETIHPDDVLAAAERVFDL